MEIVEIEGGFKDFFETNEHLIFHTLEYKKFVEKAFDCKYRILGFLDHNQVKTLLPLVEIKSRIFGNKIISAAYIEYGGFAGDQAYVKDLINFITKKYHREYEHLEIRGGMEEFEESILSAQLLKKNLYHRFVLKLSSKEEVWKKIQKSKRKAIKKSLKNLQVKEVPYSDLNELYNLYCRNMRDFGSPPYSKKYFISFYDNMIKIGLGKIYGAYHHGRLVSMLLGFCYRKRVHILIAVSDKKYQELRVNDATHWVFMKWAMENGYEWFDFGRVREESGQFEFKRKWGGELQELPSYFLLWKGKEASVADPSNPKYKLMLKAWKITPLWFTKLAGMKLRKELGI